MLHVCTGANYEKAVQLVFTEQKWTDGEGGLAERKKSVRAEDDEEMSLTDLEHIVSKTCILYEKERKNIHRAKVGKQGGRGRIEEYEENAHGGWLRK